MRTSQVVKRREYKPDKNDAAGKTPGGGGIRWSERRPDETEIPGPERGTRQYCGEAAGEAAAPSSWPQRKLRNIGESKEGASDRAQAAR